MRTTEKYVLENGLKIYLKKDKGKEIVSCGVWINQGGKNEDLSNSGLSHLVEHLMFQIDSKESQLSMVENIDHLTESGAMFNAATNKESTCFYIQGLNSNLKTFIETLSYFVVNKEKVKKSDLEKEKNIVLRESGEYLMSSAQMADRMAQALWGNSCYGNMVIGNEENINSFTCEDIDLLISNTYTPDNSVIVVFGDFDTLEVKKLIDLYFSKWKGVYKGERKKVVKNDSRLFVDDRFAGDRTTMAIGFEGYSIRDIKFQYLEILKKLMTESNSMFLKRLRDEMEVIYSLNGFTNAFSETGYIGMFFSAYNKDLKDIVRIIFEEIKALKENGVDEKLFEDLKRKRLLEVIISSESSLENMLCIGDSAIVGHEFILESTKKDIKSLNIETMNKVINEVFTDEKLCAAVLGSAGIDEIKPFLKVNDN